MHCVAPAVSAKEPAEQLAHTLSRPVSLLKVPGLQSVQTEDPLLSAYDPGPHREHDTFGMGEKDPAMQSTHVLKEVAPTAAEKVPLAHTTHAVALDEGP
jgi:hypothetical protein